jgi:hypothetical protein
MAYVPPRPLSFIAIYEFVRAPMKTNRHEDSNTTGGVSGTMAHEPRHR